MPRKTKRAKASRSNSIEHVVTTIQGSICKINGLYLSYTKSRPIKVMNSLRLEVAEFEKQNTPGYTRFMADDKQRRANSSVRGPKPYDDNISFGGVKYEDYRPYRNLYSVFTPTKKGLHHHHKHNMTNTQVEDLLNLIRKDIQHLFGVHALKMVITEISILGFGATVQPYHQDDKASDPPADCEWKDQAGSLVYNLTTTKSKCALKVMTMGEGGHGYCTTTQVIHEDQVLWFDDWVVHAGDIHDGPCVRLHVHVDLIEKQDRKQKEVYLVPKTEVDKKYKAQKDFTTNDMQF
jgi:hypothetical protein